ncbi:MAG: hypothetical protein AAB289_09760 [Chloroflexota bacterium]
MKAFYHADSQALTIRTRLISRHLNREPQRSRFSALLGVLEGADLKTTTATGLIDAGLFARAGGPGEREMLIEAVLEYARRARFNGLPSRAGALFLTPTLGEAKRFAELVPVRCGHIHCCLAEPDDGALLDWSLIAPAASWDLDAPLDRLAAMADAYWSAANSGDPLWEFVTHGQVMVLQRME